MKRRNAESGKMRRPVKRNKITEGIYGSTLLYVKFVLLWAMVIFADYMMEFRFEFLWPFWMMLRSVYDSFKYQGFAFSVFFICIALTSDMICFFYIPVQWVFFAASTYVWVQYVWYTDKGICLPTVALCAALVYVEAGVRREAGRVGQLDLCRPFAAHCVGYPVVTLGFGVKSYVGHRMRLRKQREVQSENIFYYQLLKQALPEAEDEQPTIKDSSGDKSLAIANGSINKIESETKHMNGHAVQATKSKKFEKELKSSEWNRSNHSHEESFSQSSGKADRHLSNHNHALKDKENNYNKANNHHNAAGANAGGGIHSQSNGVGHHDNTEPTDDKLRQLRQHSSDPLLPSAEEKKSRNEYKHNDSQVLDNSVNSEKSKGTKNNPKGEKKDNSNNGQREERRRSKKDTSDKEKLHENKEKEHYTKDRDMLNISNSISTAGSKDTSTNTSHDRTTKERDRNERERERCAEREQRERDCALELRRVRASEAELRKALAASTAHERQRRQDNQLLKHANEELNVKVASLTSLRNSERAASERRVSDERRARIAAEAQLTAARQQQQQRTLQYKTGECGGEWCRSRRASAEAEEAGLRCELQRMRDHVTKLTRDLKTSAQQVSTLESRCRDSAAAAASRSASATSEQEQQQVLASALATLHERASHLECSLSAETRIKLDLFSALGEAKRQLEIREVLVRQQDREINELKAKIAQMLAVMPCESSVGAGSAFKMRLGSPAALDDQNNSCLDPNASVYTPKRPAVDHATVHT